MKKLMAMVALVVVPFMTTEATGADFPYIPIQPALTGDWYSPDRNGEGLDIALIPSEEEGGQPVLWVKLFGLGENGSGFWVVAQSEIRNAWSPRYNDYAFWLLSPQSNGQGELVGHLVLTVADVDSILMDYYVKVDGVEHVVHASMLSQLVKGEVTQEGFVGFCNHHLTFSPPYPAIQEEKYCPHIYSY